ncbi:ABC transporter permease [Candidatus Parcubacteria bacterium]|nr:ABC transporter permease [Candidatus Parcubacteria bacterium]
MFKTNVKRIIKSGFFGFFRNGFVSLSSVLVMVITLSVIASVIFMSAILNSSLEEIRNKVDVNVYFFTTAQESDILALKKSIEKLPEVKQVEYVSAKEELENFKTRHENDQFTLQALDELSENPLGAKLNIKAKEPHQYEGIAAFLTGENIISRNGQSIVDNVNFPRNKTAIDKLSKIISSAQKLGFFFTLLLIIVSILITFNTIRLVIFISRDEISVMRLVGASALYIRGPFVVSGVLYGVLSGIFTLIIFYPLAIFFGSNFPSSDFDIGFNVLDYYISNFAQTFLIVMGSGIFIGAVSSYLAVKRYLKI